MKSNVLYALLASAFVLSLVACGGGGGVTGPDPLPTPKPDQDLFRKFTITNKVGECTGLVLNMSASEAPITWRRPGDVELFADPLPVGTQANLYFFREAKDMDACWGMMRAGKSCAPPPMEDISPTMGQKTLRFAWTPVADLDADPGFYGVVCNRGPVDVVVEGHLKFDN